MNAIQSSAVAVALLLSAACTPPRPPEPDASAMDIVEIAQPPMDSAGMDRSLPDALPDVVAEPSQDSSESDASDVTPREAATQCRGDDECSDGVFCNGRERCSPGVPGADARGCASATVPACRPEQTCDERAGRCVTDCAAGGDADGDGVRAVECGGNDCDDSNAMRRPGAAEVCDANDVDEDCNPLTFGSRDRDGDGFVDRTCCNTNGAGTRTCGTDCNDFRRVQFPGALEVCNGIDEDCDGVADNGVTQSFFADRDFDLYGASGATAVQACPGLRGYSTVDTDCDDTDSSVSGPQPEFCDGRDNNCNGMADERTQPVRWYPDDDGDGFGVERGAMSSCAVPVPHTRWVLRAGDCDDADATINPAAAEVCDGRDNNCNGRAEFRISAGDYEDDDGDGAADARCAGFGTDCNDNNPEIYGSFVDALGRRVSAASELCDGLDNDCNARVDDRMDNVDWYPDTDGDGFGDRSAGPLMSCTIRAGLVRNHRDCDDGNANRNPLVIDPCNGIDDDCDGAVDEDAPTVVWFRDRDRDGYGIATETTAACRRPSADAMGGWSDRGDDCSDSDPLVHPTAAERCNMIDDNCDGRADDGALRTFYEDADRDGHASMAAGRASTMACVAPAGFAEIADDCDDGDDRRFPGNSDVCDGVDNDCDVVIDQASSANLSCARPHATSVCASARCSSLVCDSNYANCNGAASDGCEVNTTTLSNCGGCGVSCARANATASCATGSCELLSCQSGFGNCDSNDGNGCESPTNAVSNCGTCGTSCATGGTCSASGGGFVCTCPGAAGRVCGGRCVDTAIDASHCGACGNACPASATCVTTAGVSACQCPATAATVCGGRCVDTLSDRNHCGACGSVCPTSCVSGACSRAIDVVLRGGGGGCVMLDDAAHSVRCWGRHVGNGSMADTLVQTTASAAWGASMARPLRFGRQDADGSVYVIANASGANSLWYWGNNNITELFSGVAYAPIESPAVVGAFDDFAVSQAHACTVRAASVYCFGFNFSGQCGQPASGTRIATATQVAGISNASSVVVDRFDTFVLTSNGTVQTFGYHTGTHAPTPLLIPGRSIVAMSAQSDVSPYFVVDDGQVFTIPGALIPNWRALPAGELAAASVARTGSNNAYHACVVLRSGQVRCEGTQDFGALGNGVDARDGAFTPWQIVQTSMGVPLTDVVRVVGGHSNFCALRADGTVYCWGANGGPPNDGLLGDGSLTHRVYATPIAWP